MPPRVHRILFLLFLFALRAASGLLLIKFGLQVIHHHVIELDLFEAAVILLELFVQNSLSVLLAGDAIRVLWIDIIV